MLAPSFLFQCFFLERAQGRDEAAPGAGNQTGLVSLEQSAQDGDYLSRSPEEPPPVPARAEYIGHSPWLALQPLRGSSQVAQAALGVSGQGVLAGA